MHLFPTLLLLLLLLTLPKRATSQCTHLCAPHGKCDIYGRCICNAGFTGTSCTLRTCLISPSFTSHATADDTSHLPTECAGRGNCDRETGLCVCSDGFTGEGCQRMSCPDNCNGNGICTSMRNHALTSRDVLTGLKYTYNNVWDADKTFGCVCDSGFTGYDCSLKECPTGDDPLTNDPVQANTQIVFRCTSNPSAASTFAFYYNGFTSGTIAGNMGVSQVRSKIEMIYGIGTVQVTFSPSGTSTTVCQTSPSNIVTVEFLDVFGVLTPLVPNVNGLVPVGSNVVVYANGESVTDDIGNTYTSVTGTKESEVCAGRGTCNTETGSCTCYDDNGDAYTSSNGYALPGIRGDCGAAFTSILNCPGEIACSGHGACSGAPSLKCSCSKGWTGGKCDERACDYGKSWFSYPTSDEVSHDVYVECSNMGICDTQLGTCTCASGYYGSACQYLSCGGASRSVTNACSGHGRCLSNRQLSFESTDNGDATDYVYGTDSNNANTWDADRMFGCECDEGFHGYDCSLMTCMSGADSGWYTKVQEVQLLFCEADVAAGATFRLMFRQEVTGDIQWDASALQIKTELEKLSSINTINVEFISTRTGVGGELTTGFCNSRDWETTHGESNTLLLTFHSPAGDVPDVVIYDVSSTSSIDITLQTNGTPLPSATPTSARYSGLSVRGTTVSEVCGNRGVCDEEFGECQCNLGWISSDGNGGQGALNDCGLRRFKQGVLEL